MIEEEDNEDEEQDIQEVSPEYEEDFGTYENYNESEVKLTKMDPVGTNDLEEVLENLGAGHEPQATVYETEIKDQYDNEQEMHMENKKKQLFKFDFGSAGNGPNTKDELDEIHSMRARVEKQQQEEEGAMVDQIYTNVDSDGYLVKDDLELEGEEEDETLERG